MTKINESVYLKAPIRAVKYIKIKESIGSEFYDEILIWGEGDVLHFKGKEFKIPGSERIIGIHQGNTGNLNFIFVRTEFNLFHLRKIEDDDSSDLKLIIEKVPLDVRDRILNILAEEDQLWVVLARGTVQSFIFIKNENKFINDKNYSLVDLSAVFYSAAIVRISNVKLEISLGSIFSGIFLTQINELDSSDTIFSVLNLKGHTGTIFDLTYDTEKNNTLVSCSDDRSILIWEIDRTTDNLSYKCVATCIGHEARIWSLDLKSDHIASASEDNTCRLWSIYGQIIDVFEGDPHSKSIWSVALNSKADKLSSGSNDGSVLTHNLNTKICPFLVDYHLSDIFGKMKNFVATPQGVAYLSTDLDKILRLSKTSDDEISIKIVTEIDGIGSYSKMAISSTQLFIGNDKGIFYYSELVSEETEMIFNRIEISSKAQLSPNQNKISNIYIQYQYPEIVFVELNDHCLYLFDISNSITYKVSFDEKLKVSSVLLSENKSRLFIGTRQGLLLIFECRFDELLEFNLVKTVQVSDMESLKSIRIEKEFISISVIDRLGFEYIILTSNYQIIEKSKKIKGNFENHLQKFGFTLSFHQQNLLINGPFGVYAKLFCGGGHRLWNSSSDLQNFAFSFISKNNFSIFQGSLNRTESIASRSHGKEIRCARVLNQDGLTLSGSEDGLLVLFKDSKPVYDVRLSNVSIKCITSCDDLILVGGSNESIEVLSLSFFPVSFLLSHVSSCPKQIQEVETRVLSLECIKNDFYDDSIILLAGYSDASIRIFEYKRKNNCFRLLTSIEKVHNVRCVQQLRIISFENFILKFISAGADGVIKGWFYDLSESLSSKVEMVWNRSLHESGINSLEIKRFNSINEDFLFILTGGDDGNVSKLIFDLKNDKIVSVQSRQYHNSAVTCLNFIESSNSTALKIISSSIDRFIVIYNENLEELEVKRSVISDIAAMTLTFKSNHKQKHDHITVYGVGQESFDYVV